jgi:hypothetical protein
MTLQQYAEAVYFPNIKTKKSPSTKKGLLQSLHETDSAARRWTQTLHAFDIQRISLVFQVAELGMIGKRTAYFCGIGRHSDLLSSKPPVVRMSG